MQARRHFGSDLGGQARASADGFTSDKPVGVEAKFGPDATLSYAQKRADSLLGTVGRYYVDHWLPQDVAKGIGGLLGIPASQASSKRNSHK